MKQFYIKEFMDFVNEMYSEASCRHLPPSLADFIVKQRWLFTRFIEHLEEKERKEND